MIIFRSVGPVISTRRSCKSCGMGATVQSARRMCSVCGRKSGRIARRRIRAVAWPCRGAVSPAAGQTREPIVRQIARRRGSECRSIDLRPAHAPRIKRRGLQLAHRTLSSFALFFRRVSPGKIIPVDLPGVNCLFSRTQKFSYCDGRREISGPSIGVVRC